MPHRLFIAKRPAFQRQAAHLERLKEQLNIPSLLSWQSVAIYDIHHCPEALLERAQSKVFADPVSDEVLDKLPESDFTLVVEPLPGQFDQRADSAEQCLRLIDSDFADTVVTSAVAYLFTGALNDDERERLRNHFINPIESREKDLSVWELPEPHEPAPVPRYEDFNALDDTALLAWHEAHGLAMTPADLALVQDYFREQGRAPSETEIRVLDTYWSDHCRHTTFTTRIESLEFPAGDFGNHLRQEWSRYQDQRQHVYGTKAESRGDSLMDLATIDAKYLRQLGKIDDVEFSAEVNACSVFVDVDEDGQQSKWLLQFKNETHNHPTEIEPYGGAATCIGGAIRDPLSGRAFVYQALRLSGSADPREPIGKTLPGKLPQSVIAEGSAAGASSYGNQIGLATGQVVELYHPGYKAKHMEVGAVVAATPADHVVREEPQAGDVVLLLGGATGRDGCGGATGSSRAQHGESLSESAAEVQKGNPPEERKLQRLFRKKAFARHIKRCNDFGAGGVAVAIGELADGLSIDLDQLPVKYQGLSGTELAISESQERMAVVVNPQHVATMQALAAEENLTATHIADITDDDTLTMRWRGEVIVSLKRAFLDTAGADLSQSVVRLPDINQNESPLASDQSDNDWSETLKTQLASLEFADQRGLGDRFDHSVGAAGVLLPYGGYSQRTPAEASVYMLPTEGQTHTASILAYGFNPNLSAWSPYHGGVYAVIEATARLVACGGDANKAHFSLQEYFRRLGDNPEYWGLPYAALLGAHYALSRLERAAIGGKDSMSGSFNDLHVPPTLIAFAVSTVDTRQVISPEFKAAGHQLYWLRCPQNALGLPDMDAFIANNQFIHEAINEGLIQSIRSVRHGGIMQALYESALGNRIGVEIEQLDDLFGPEYGGYLISAEGGLGIAPNLFNIGYTVDEATLSINGVSEDIDTLHEIAENVLESVYPLNPSQPTRSGPVALASAEQSINHQAPHTAKPRVCLPVFPGINSELDTARAFQRAGGIVEETLICNRNRSDIEHSLTALVDNLNNSQIMALSGGFSAGDEPDGSGKFIVAVLSNPQIADAVAAFLERGGLILGICNGFQALIKSGLLPHGIIRTPEPGDPTLTHNLIDRHIARVASTVVANNHSPWLADFKVGEIHDVAFSHGEGRFVANDQVILQLVRNGQIATQYAHPFTGEPSLEPRYNPNGSDYAVEGITSPCGQIYGKMGHSERHQLHGQQNYPDFRAQDIFRAGIRAF
ncbi:phosphoribosylformylglycinamidine synthase [Suttonella sp. R2A3]|uniref:phosphoribosylformylglycinamidine synthase n=1 Tax=Suttonella sp. R2A3 TaxID=2908648 RepID=UPI001F2B60E1|nr:phosphoribosylformylglycinamidine synthase [Suttonella sp. R2A3]UJF24981.1 phosphoribosylformylglycinamidine synthase [Suttonella sp. R2A3]